MTDIAFTAEYDSQYNYHAGVGVNVTSQVATNGCNIIHSRANHKIEIKLLMSGWTSSSQAIQSYYSGQHACLAHSYLLNT